jgi:hypothetical protein
MTSLHPLPEPEVAERNLEAVQRRLGFLRLTQPGSGASEAEIAMAAQAELQARAICRLSRLAARRAIADGKLGHCSPGVD